MIRIWRKKTIKRFGAALLAFCMVLPLLYLYPLATDVAESMPPLVGVEGESEPMESRGDSEENSIRPLESFDFPEDASFGGVSVQSTYDFSVETKEATDVTAFSATLSMTIMGNWYPYGKVMKVYGFQYCIGTTFDEAKAHEWEESINGEIGTIKYLDAVHYRACRRENCRL